MTIEFFIPLVVKPKQSTRFGGGRAFPKKETLDNAAQLAAFASRHRPDSPIDQPVRARYVFQRAYLKKDGKRAAMGETIPDDTGADLGNRVKQLEDVLESVGILANDTRIWDCEAKKVRTAQCGVQVWLSTDGG
jgi:Holliday junction resolvase RusA-like endonuclease